MITIENIDPQRLDEKGRLSLQKLTEPKYYPCLEGQHPDEVTNAQVVLLVALQNNQPLGLLVGSFVPILRSAELHSLFVDEKFRNQQIASTLLQEFEKELKKQKAIVVTFLYPVENAFSSIYENIFQKQNWEKPIPFSIQCLIKNSFDAPWLNKPYPLPHGFHELYWRDLNETERDQLKSEADRQIIPGFLSPFGRNEKIIEPANSLVLINEKRVIGWMITHRIAPDTIRYSSLYISPEWQHKGPAMRLLCDAIKYQTHSTIPWALFETNLSTTDKAWIKALRERIMPYAHTTTHINQLWKKL